MDIALGARSQLTGRFNFVKDPLTGDVSFDDTEAHAVMTSAMEDLQGYWADSTHGNEVHELENLSARTPSQARAMTLASLDPLARQNRITNVDVEAERNTETNGLGRLDVNLRWTTPGGSNSEDAQV